MTAKKKTAKTVACELVVGANLADDLPSSGRFEAGDTVELPEGHWLIEQGYAIPKKKGGDG